MLMANTPHVMVNNSFDKKIGVSRWKTTDIEKTKEFAQNRFVASMLVRGIKMGHFKQIVFSVVFFCCIKIVIPKVHQVEPQATPCRPRRWGYQTKGKVKIRPPLPPNNVQQQTKKKQKTKTQNKLRGSAHLSCLNPRWAMKFKVLPYEIWTQRLKMSWCRGNEIQRAHF